MSESKIYIGNISANVLREDLDSFVSDIGKIMEVKMMRGYAFVEYADSRAARDAVEELNGKSINGEGSVRVELARGTRDRPSRDSRVPREYATPRGTGFRLRIYNLSPDVSWQDLKDFIRQVGDATFTDVDGHGEGLVEMYTEEAMLEAIRSLDGKDLKGQAVRVTEELPDATPFVPGRPPHAYRRSPGYRRRSPSPRRDSYREPRAFERPHERYDRGSSDRGYDKGYDRGYKSYRDRDDRDTGYGRRNTSPFSRRPPPPPRYDSRDRDHRSYRDDRSYRDRRPSPPPRRSSPRLDERPEEMREEGRTSNRDDRRDERWDPPKDEMRDDRRSERRDDRRDRASQSDTEDRPRKG